MMIDSNEIPFSEPVWASDGDNACYTTHWEIANGKNEEYEFKI